MKKFSDLKIALNWIKAEVEPALDIPELAKTSRADIIELIDWELKRVAEAQKMFGVTVWSLLVGFGVVSWAFVSMPDLAKINIGQVLWAFLLLETILILGETIWALFINYPKLVKPSRTLRLSTIGGDSTKPILAVTALRFLTLFVMSFALPSVILPRVLLVMRVVIVLGLMSFAFFLLLLKCGIPLLPEEKKSKPKIRASVIAGTMRFCSIIGPFYVLPIVVWGSAIILICVPEMGDFRLAVLLVAAGYLLRFLLVLGAQAHHQPFLQQLRRDVVLGFITPDKAALQLCWRVSELPQEIYVNGRLRALTAELTKLETNLQANTKALLNAAKSFRELPNEQQISQTESLSKWLGSFLSAETAKHSGTYAKIRGAAFLVFGKKKAEGTLAYLEWEAARKAVEVAGNEYAQARSGIDSLIQKVRADNEHATIKSN